MLAEYLPILIFLAVAGGLGVLLMTLGFLFGPRRPDPARDGEKDQDWYVFG